MATQAADVILRFKADSSGLSANVKKAMGKTQKATKKVNGSIDSLNRRMGKGTKVTKKLTSSKSKLSQAMQGLSSATNIFLGLGLYRAFGAGTKIVREAISAQVEFNKVLAETNSIVNGSQATIEFFQKELLELSQVVPQSPAELGGGAYQTLSAGFLDAADASIIMEKAARAASAGLTDTNTAVDAITTTLNAYNLSAEQSSKVSDLLFQTVKRGKLRFEELASNIGQVVTVAAQSGVRMEELFAAIQTTTKGGLSASRSMTALRQAIQNIVAPSNQAKQMAEELGIELGGAALSTKGLMGFFEEFTEATGLAGKEVRTLVQDMAASGATLDQMKGRLEQLGDSMTLVNEIFTSRRGLLAATTLAGGRLDAFRENLAATENAQGAMQSAFERATDSISAQSQIMKNNLAVAFQATIPALRDLVDLGVDIAETLADNREAIEATSKILLTLVGAFAALKVAQLGYTVALEAHAAIQEIVMAFAVSHNKVMTTKAPVINSVTGNIQVQNSVLAKNAAMWGKNGAAQAAASEMLVQNVARYASMAAVMAGLATIMITVTDGTSDLQRVMQGVTTALFMAAGAALALRAGLGGVGAVISSIVAGGAAFGLIEGIEELNEGMSRAQKEADEFNTALKGTANDVEAEFFDRIKKASTDTRIHFEKELKRMRETAQTFAQDAGNLAIQGAITPQFSSGGASRESQRLRSLTDISGSPINRVTGAISNGFEATRRAFIESEGFIGGAFGGALFELMGGDSLTTARLKRAEELEAISKTLSSRKVAEQAATDAIVNGTDAFNENKDIIASTAQMIAKSRTAEAVAKAKEIQNAEERAQRLETIQEQRADIFHDLMGQAEAASIASKLQAANLGLSASQAENLAKRIVDTNAELKAVENASGNIVFKLEGASDSLDEMIDSARESGKTIAEFAENFESGAFVDRLIGGDGVMDFIDKVIDLTSDMSNLSDETKKTVEEFKQFKELISALEFIQLLKGLNLGSAFTEGVDRQVERLDALLQEQRKTTNAAKGVTVSKVDTSSIFEAVRKAIGSDLPVSMTMDQVGSIEAILTDAITEGLSRGQIRARARESDVGFALGTNRKIHKVFKSIFDAVPSFDKQLESQKKDGPFGLSDADFVDLVRLAIEESGLSGKIGDDLSKASIEELIKLFFRSQEEMKSFADRASDIVSAMGSFQEPLELARDQWHMVGSRLENIGITMTDVDNALQEIAQVQILDQMLGFLQNLKQIQDNVASPKIPGLSDAIKNTQLNILTQGQEFINSLQTQDPVELAKVLAENQRINQTINNNENTNIVLRLSGGRDFASMDAAKFADDLMKEFRQRRRQQGGGVRQ